MLRPSIDSRILLTGRESIDDSSWVSLTQDVFDNFLDSSLGPFMGPLEGHRVVVL